MDIWNQKSRIVITCPKRVSSYLEEEVRALGFVPDDTTLTHLSLTGTIFDCIKLNLNLRCASQVLFLLKKFTSNHPEDVYETLKEMPWEEILSPHTYLSVKSSVDHYRVNNPLYMNLKVKDAVADRLREKTGQRPDSGPDLKGIVLQFYWQEQNAEIFLDTSGETLAKHGYRKHPGQAPMMEALAASTLLATQWNSQTSFINPMCGSGTLAIEAALIATHRKPGLLRNNYSFMHLKNFKSDFLENEIQFLKNDISDVTAKIIASDIRPEAIEIAKLNAQEAGVEDFIEFHVCDFEETPVPAPPGVIYFNPEYGERLGDIPSLEKTYARIGDFLKKKCAGYTGYIFTGNLDLAKKIRLNPSRRFEFYSAKLDCRLLKYEMYSGTKRTDL